MKILEDFLLRYSLEKTILLLFFLFELETRPTRWGHVPVPYCATCYVFMYVWVYQTVVITILNTTETHKPPDKKGLTNKTQNESQKVII